jgi:hypothetical protein
MLELQFQPFIDYIQRNTIAKSRDRYNDSIIADSTFENNEIKANVFGSRSYSVKITLGTLKVKSATCTCPYDGGGVCKHIINVIVTYDPLVIKERLTIAKSEIEDQQNSLIRLDDKYVIEGKKVLELSLNDIKELSNNFRSMSGAFRLIYGKIQANNFSAKLGSYYAAEASCQIEQRENMIVCTCTCSHKASSLCKHLNFFFEEIATTQEFDLAFDAAYRHEVMQKSKKKFGLVGDMNLDELFEIIIENNRLNIEPKFNFLNFNHPALLDLKKELEIGSNLPVSQSQTNTLPFILFTKLSYSDDFEIELMQAPLSMHKTIKNPIAEIGSNVLINGLSNPELFSFFSSIKTYRETKKRDRPIIERIKIVKSILDNPLAYPFYYFDENESSSGRVTAKNIQEVKVAEVTADATIFVKQKQDFYVLTCKIQLDNSEFNSKSLRLADDVFVWSQNQLLFISNPHVLSILRYFSQNKHELFVHKTQFSIFQEEFLNRLENSMKVVYEYVKPAPTKLIKQLKLDSINEYMIYLSESDNFILITPVVKYGETEVGALSKRNVYAEDPTGGLYAIERKDADEQRFIRAVQSQHPWFEEQIGSNEFYYLEKETFLEDGWFLEAFEFWRGHNYSILGFNQLKNNRLNTNKMQVKTTVSTGIDWFEIDAEVSYGGQQISLKEIQKSIVNKSKYIELSDGTLGVLPEEWIKKFGNYFRSGEVKEGKIHLHKTNFSMIDELFDQEVLSIEAQEEVRIYKEKLANFSSISSIEVPKKLKGTLRDYQKEGLNWLNFLDEFGFGGCLADDMGLGKTIQIIAYFLSQIEKGNNKPNLVVLPTSLLFNWQLELKKFAPHLKIKIIYGINRDLEKGNFDNYNLVLTTYGTLLSDIDVLKEVVFNCVVLDESQAIKNPTSKRYKSVRLLKARQRIVMTGTPVENNTFDLYAQLSFALPGLLGSSKKFADNYSTPIDKYQDSIRAKELQAKIHPFVLRRTKSQVAKELPEKTEMIIHCEMGPDQRRVYEVYKKEFQDLLSQSDTKEGNSTLNILQGLTKLRQICNSPALLSDEAYYGAESAKLTELMEQIEAKKDDHKMLVFSQFVTMLDLVKEKLDKANIGYAYLTGKTKNRQQQVELFQNDEKIRVFLISLKAGGTGLNLTKAEYVFLIDPWWNPAVENQAIDRAYRIGQENKVIAIRLISPNTIEEKIIELQQRKKQLANDLVHTDVNVLKQLSKSELMKMV